MDKVRVLSCDIETFSSADLGKSGVYRYVESPDFEILLCGYSFDGEPVRVIDLANGEQLPDDVTQALTDNNVIKVAHNANFERVCLSRYLGLPTGKYLDPSSWRCTMVWAATLGLPLSLKGVGTILGLEKQKLEEGKDLIKYFCMPCKPTSSNGYRNRNLPEHAIDKWETFKAYNLRDVETEMEIAEKLSRFPVPEDVWHQYHIDQEINDRGIMVDMQLVKNAIDMDSKSHIELAERMRKLTSLENPDSVSQMRSWLSEHDVETETLGKKDVSALLKTAPESIRPILELRQQLAKTSVRKYIAMWNAVCSDHRARGMFQFGGASRTLRWAGRIVQLQNLPQNHLPDLDAARELVRLGDYGSIQTLYDSVPDVLSELIRTAFIAPEGKQFYVADFSAIEARVIAWLAGEEWRMDLFRNGGDIYCQSASTMFNVPVEKHGVNGHLRQKGKVAELACIAEGSLVLTDSGLIPIEKVSPEMLVWDGESWAHHDGVVYRGEREVITYEGLTATPDHLVWIEGKSEPVQFGIAAASRSHLVQTGNGGIPIWLGKNHITRKALEPALEPLLCSDTMHRLRGKTMAVAPQFAIREVKRMSILFPTITCSDMVEQTAGSVQTTLRKSKGSWVSQLRSKRYTLLLQKRKGCRALSDCRIWNSDARSGNRQDRHKWQLCTWQYSFCNSFRELYQSAQKCFEQLRATILAVLTGHCNKKTIIRDESERNNKGCGKSSNHETKELALNRSKARVYDIRNAGQHNRFTVSGHLVHNCGYGGSVGALKAMGALEMGLKEEELQPLVDAWRQANPAITKLWRDVDKAAMTAVSEKTSIETHGLRFTRESGFLFITLPSGRRLAYVKPMIGENRFGSPSITYEGTGATKKWERLETFGGKLVENIVQAIARDILCYAMNNLRDYGIVAHVHDELIIEAPPETSLKEICELMGQVPPWAPGLVLQADGYTCSSYRKD